MNILDEFVDALLHCDTVKVILTGCGESVFETKEIYEDICKLYNENAELKARLSKAVEIEQQEDIEWEQSESNPMKSGSEPMHCVYTHKITGEKYRLGDLQDKYELGFADSKLWKIIEREYEVKSCPQREWPKE